MKLAINGKEVETADFSMKAELVFWAIILARVVFPEPGGPQKMIDLI